MRQAQPVVDVEAASRDAVAAIGRAAASGLAKVVAATLHAVRA